MSLVQLLTDAQRNTTQDDGGDWRRYILDHLDYLASRSPRHTVDETILFQYRGNVDWYIKNHLMQQEQIGWIVRLLNNFNNDFDFKSTGELIVPEDSLVIGLYQAYLTIQSNAQ